MTIKKGLWIGSFVIFMGLGGAIFAPSDQVFRQFAYWALLGLYFSVMFQRTPSVSIKSSFLGWIWGGLLVGFLLGWSKHNTVLEVAFLSIQVAAVGFILAVIDNLLRSWR